MGQDAGDSGGLAGGLLLGGEVRGCLQDPGDRAGAFSRAGGRGDASPQVQGIHHSGDEFGDRQFGQGTAQGGDRGKHRVLGPELQLFPTCVPVRQRGERVEPVGVGGMVGHQGDHLDQRLGVRLVQQQGECGCDQASFPRGGQWHATTGTGDTCGPQRGADLGGVGVGAHQDRAAAGVGVAFGECADAVADPLEPHVLRCTTFGVWPGDGLAGCTGAVGGVGLRPDLRDAELHITGEQAAEQAVRQVQRGLPGAVGVGEDLGASGQPGGIGDRLDRRIHQCGVRAAEAVDGLFRVTDPDHLVDQAGELGEQGELQGAGVLELVDDEDPEPCGEGLAHRVPGRVSHPVAAQQTQGELFLVGEVDEAEGVLVVGVGAQAGRCGGEDEPDECVQVSAQRGVDENLRGGGDRPVGLLDRLGRRGHPGDLALGGLQPV